jgi:hypothetical protein
MAQRLPKLQITLSQELLNKIEMEVDENYMTKTTFINKLINDYFDQKKGSKVKKIDLNIKKG